MHDCVLLPVFEETDNFVRLLDIKLTLFDDCQQYFFYQRRVPDYQTV